MPAPILELQDIHKQYPDGAQALEAIHLTVKAGEIVALLGPSGCGKTTLLRVVAGLEQPTRGRVLFNSRDLAAVPVHQRGFGFMFQDFALFPHRNVADNIAFGLRMAGWSKAAITARVEVMLDLVNLPGYGARSIFALSGGERQRVALARSLAPQPTLLMLDEPLGSLDLSLREELLEELRAILRRAAVTTLYVTHDQDEAIALADHLVIMHRGRIQQIDTPIGVYTHPATPFVARFMGFTNLITATPSVGGISTPWGHLPLALPSSMTAPASLLIRPEAARLITDPIPHDELADGFHPLDPGGHSVRLTGTLTAKTFHGNEHRIQLLVSRGEHRQALTFRLPAYQRDAHGLLAPAIPGAVGERLHLAIFTDLTHILPYAPDQE
jgi:thiamine transport system ATP-binding protein